MLKNIILFLKKHQGRATVVGLGVGLVVFIGLGVYLQKSNSREKAKKVEKPPVKVELQINSTNSSGDPKNSARRTNSFFLRPTPAELLEQLAEMENLQEDVAQRKLQYLRVLWPVYYFGLEQLAGREMIVLDISKDGFGVVVKGEIKSEQYPELVSFEAGEKIWVAGEIAAVDPSGTGTVYLNIELLDFTENGPPSAKIAEEPKE